MAVSVSSFGGLNGYWGQYGSEPLRSYCDSGVEFVTLSFVNVAPEHDLSGYPGTNFAGHCSAGTYSNKDGVPSNLLSHCDIIKEDIPYCKERGVKVLLSIGGVYNTVGSNYEVSSDDKGSEFADFLYSAFGPYDPSWDGPRPFDLSETEHTAVDGFDFDIEAALDNAPYIAMIDELRSLDSSIIITGAPQCPTNDPYFYMKDMINQAAFDALFIQFYNNPGCDAIDDPLISWDNFNYDDWETIVANSENSKNAKLYVGLPAASNAAGSGYISPEDLKDLVCELKDKAHFGGISLWDLTRGAANVIDGKSYNEHALDALMYGCDSIPTDTATSTVVSTTATSASESTTEAVTTTATETTGTETTASETTATETTATETTATETTATETTASETTATVSATETTSETTAETTESATASTDITSDVSTTAEISTTFAGNSSTVVSTTETDFSTSATAISSTHTFSTFSWSNTTFTSATISETSTGSGSETTNTGSASQTSGSGSETTNTGFTSGDVTATTATTGSISMTTSVVYTTEVHTVTKCPPYVHNCPEGGYVTTKTIALYTTVCPVSGEHSKPTSSKPTITKAPSYETKTLYTTNVHTITSCPPEVHNCPVGSVTTEVSSWYTTVVHVTETLTAEGHKPTDESPAPPAYTGGHNGGEECSENCGEIPEEKTTTELATSTIYRTVIVPPATLETSTKPAVFTPQPKPHYSGKEQPSGVAVPTGGCTGEGCPDYTSVPAGGCTGEGCPAYTSVPSGVPTAPVTAGASTLAAGLTGLVAMMVFAL